LPIYSRKLARGLEHDLAKGSRVSRVVTQPPEPRPPSDEDRAEAAALAARSLGRSRQALDLALSEPCANCHAPAGVYCYVTVKGMCRQRRERGQVLADATPTNGVGELDALAAATRNAARNRRLRPRTFAAGRSL
jgi:hypothetical protein